ncbi:MAG: hypothetical protein WC625_06965 [Caldisericia bacterium]
MSIKRSQRSFIKSVVFLFLIANIYPGILFLLDSQHWYWWFRDPFFWLDIAAIVGSFVYLAKEHKSG